MQIFEMFIGGHNWVKKNLVTMGKKRMYDLYQCSRCGLQGKSYHFGLITIRDCDIAKMKRCLNENIKTYTRLKVINCTAFGEQFTKLTPGSVHNIIDPPEGCDNSRGEWVQGLSEPVLLLAGEFVYLED